jgi:hypothetical protein
LLDLELWAELRREHFVGGVSINKLARQPGLSRNTIRWALRSDAPPAYRRAPAGSSPAEKLAATNNYLACLSDLNAGALQFRSAR